MRTLAITQNMTLDGSIEMLTDWFDPTVAGDDHVAESHRQDAAADALLVGRRTFVDFRGYWPIQEDDTTGVTDYLNHVQKYVVSSTLTDPRWAHSEIVSGDPIAAVRELKSRAGKDIVLTGSISLGHALIDAGLVDEFRLFVYPVIQGRGRGLFPADKESPAMRLLESRTFDSGVVFLRYAAA